MGEGCLGVCEEEDDLLELHARELEQVLQVLAPLYDAVVLGDLDLEELHVRDVRGEARERLAARAAHAEQQRVASGLAEHAADAADLRHGVAEEHEVHWDVLLVVLAERVVHDRRELLHARHLVSVSVSVRVRARVRVRVRVRVVESVSVLVTSS